MSAALEGHVIGACCLQSRKAMAGSQGARSDLEHTVAGALGGLLSPYLLRAWDEGVLLYLLHKWGN